MIEISTVSKKGFCLQTTHPGFKTAFITHSEEYGEKKTFKRHLETDEVFVLIEGGATIYSIEDEGERATALDRGRAYNVKRATWHHVKTTPDALLFVVEHSNTSKENTEVRDPHPEEGVLG